MLTVGNLKYSNLCQNNRGRRSPSSARLRANEAVVVSGMTLALGTTLAFFFDGGGGAIGGGDAGGGAFTAVTCFLDFFDAGGDAVTVVAVVLLVLLMFVATLQTISTLGFRSVSAWEGLSVILSAVLFMLTALPSQSIAGEERLTIWQEAVSPAQGTTARQQNAGLTCCYGPPMLATTSIRR